jgi:hypothetical protein
MNTVQGTGTTLTSLSTESDNERDHQGGRQASNDSADSDPPFPPSPMASSPPKTSPSLAEGHSPKQLLLKKPANRPSVTALAPLSSPIAEEPPSANDPGEGDCEESYNPMTNSALVPTLSIAAVAIVLNEQTEEERLSDVYSLHSDGIPEHDEEEEANRRLDDGELLDGGDGSKPVGCTACSIQ